MSGLDTQGWLAAVARFLEQEARPALADPALAFRARVGAALLRSLGAELAAAEALEEAELSRLRAALASIDGRSVEGDEPGAEAPLSEADRRAALRTVERALCDRVRAGLDPAALRRVRAAVREGLRARLAVTTPELDLSAEIE